MSTILEKIQAQADAIKTPDVGVTLKVEYVWKDDDRSEQTTGFIATVAAPNDWNLAGAAVNRGFVGARMNHTLFLQQIALGNFRLVSSLDPAE